MSITNFERTKNWLVACGKEPTAENLSVQIGCHIEEFCEFLQCLEIHDSLAMERLDRALCILENIGAPLKLGTTLGGIELGFYANALDALCDSEVTGNGVAFLAGFDKRTADGRVLDANDAKLVGGKPVILPGGKIGKPEGWAPADLSDCV